MATKYVHHGLATGNNDGTSKVDAWKDLADVFTGTFATSGGQIDPGDIIIIRSKDASGNDIELGAGITIGSSAATVTAPVTWIVDNGEEWAGIDGYVNVGDASTSGTTLVDHNIYIAKTLGGFRFVSTGTSLGSSCGVGMAESRIENWIISNNQSSNYPGHPIRSSEDGYATAVNCLIKQTNPSKTGYLAVATGSSVLTLINCELNIVSTALDAVLAGIDKVNYDYVSKVVAIGCSITGSAASTCTVGRHMVELIDCDIPITAQLSYEVSTANAKASAIKAIGIGGALGAAEVQHKRGTIDSREDGLYPYLTATLPNSSNDKWSWRLTKTVNSGVLIPTTVDIAKLYTSSTAVTQLVVNFLESNGYSLNKLDCWVDVSWIATDGTRKFVTSLDPAGGALETASSAGWYPDPPTYGVTEFNKKKFTISLSGGVKQDTLVKVRFCLGKQQPDSTHMVILCPDIQIS